MLNDIEAGRPLEVEGLLGVVIEMADKLGEPVPASRAVYALARAINPARADRSMKVVKAETILVSIPFESGGLPPWGWGGAPANTFDILLVRLETEDGLVGWGEAFSRMADVALKQLIDTRVLPLVVGRDSRQIARIKHDIEFNLHNFGRSGSIMYGISAVDIALWDIAGKRAGQPLCNLHRRAQRHRGRGVRELRALRHGREGRAPRSSGPSPRATAGSSCTTSPCR